MTQVFGRSMFCHHFPSIPASTKGLHYLSEANLKQFLEKNIRHLENLTVMPLGLGLSRDLRRRLPQTNDAQLKDDMARVSRCVPPLASEEAQGGEKLKEVRAHLVGAFSLGFRRQQL